MQEENNKNNLNYGTQEYNDTTDNDTCKIVDIKNQPKDQRPQEGSNVKNHDYDLSCHYNDINISNFEEQNYGNVFETIIFPAIKYHRKPRERVVRKLTIVFFIILGILILVGICLPEGFKYEYNPAEEHGLLENVFAFSMSIFFLYFLFLMFYIGPMTILKAFFGDSFVSPIDISLTLFNSFRKQPLAELKKKFFNSLQIEYHPVYTLYAQINEISEIMTKINPSYEKYVEADDIISFNYKNLPVSIVEFKTVGPIPSNCIFIGTKINKKVSGETFVRSKNISSSSLQTVSLEDISFSDNFSVQSFNQVEARYLLTPSFMNRLLKYRREHNNCPIDILFSSSVFNKENVFICINTQKNYFEMPEQDWQDKNKSYKIISEIKEILLIVDALKLDQDIGM